MEVLELRPDLARYRCRSCPATKVVRHEAPVAAMPVRRERKARKALSVSLSEIRAQPPQAPQHSKAATRGGRVTRLMDLRGESKGRQGSLKPPPSEV